MSTATASSSRSEILLDAGTNEVEIFEFIVNGQSFGANVAKIQQVMQLDSLKVTRLDFAPEGVMGTTIFRGKPIFVVDFHKVLRMPATKENARKLLMVTQLNQITTGFVVDGAVRIHRIGWNQFSQLDTGFGQQAAYVTGVVKVEERVMLILDLEYILAEICPASSVGGDETAAKLEQLDRPVERKNPIILFAEDSAMIRGATVNHLKKAGFDKHILASNGLEAYRHMKDFKKRMTEEGKPLSDFVQLILTDIEMPEMDGLTFCKNVRQELGLTKIPILVYSSLINDQMIAKCKSVGATDYMSKPAIEKIVEVIDRTDFDKID